MQFRSPEEMRLKLRTNRQGRANSSKSPLSRPECLRGVRDRGLEAVGPGKPRASREKARSH